ncbi:MAG: dual specificity protein phosphatase family protein [Desulfovibrio aminophilus]|uniref:protein-tyrosine phosphatase family protein n=1 Tax=Desulfovibrio aminophilus TaxID=81425 RepID=UPI0039EB7466
MSPPKAADGITWITDRLAVGGAPMSYGQLDTLRAQGITAILNLCGEFCDLHEIEADSGFEVYYLPISDEEAPDLQTLEKALEWLDEALYLGKKVYIHCRHGIGRTGTVLNAYLLRRGLGHKLAWLKLRKLRSKPSNFEQWWAVRKYGRKAGQLTVREPCLEYKNFVDLGPFLADYEALVSRAEDLFSYESGEGSRCGRDHDRCCSIPVHLSLVEAVHVRRKVDAATTSQARQQLIERAVAAARSEHEARAAVPTTAPTEFCLSASGARCPLSEDGKCLIFDFRPLQCRTHELDEETKQDLWQNVLEPVLKQSSAQLFFALTSRFPKDGPPSFSLADVVSGKYVQDFFHALMKAGKG